MSENLTAKYNEKTLIKSIYLYELYNYHEIVYFLFKFINKS